MVGLQCTDVGSKRPRPYSVNAFSDEEEDEPLPIPDSTSPVQEELD